MIVEIIGYLGAILILFAYGLLTNGVVRSTSRTYNGMNMLGGLCLCLNSFVHGATPVGILNGLFALIAAWALVNSRSIS